MMVMEIVDHLFFDFIGIKLPELNFDEVAL